MGGGAWDLASHLVHSDNLLFCLRLEVPLTRGKTSGVLWERRKRDSNCDPSDHKSRCAMPRASGEPWKEGQPKTVTRDPKDMPKGASATGQGGLGYEHLCETAPDSQRQRGEGNNGPKVRRRV